MRVIVVGGGIGGLAAGIALRNAGFETLVLERSDELTEIGAGIGLAANALRALDHLGATALIRVSPSYTPNNFSALPWAMRSLSAALTGICSRKARACAMD